MCMNIYHKSVQLCYYISSVMVSCQSPRTNRPELLNLEIQDVQIQPSFHWCHMLLIRVDAMLPGTLSAQCL